jgi:uncharacterized protein YacL
VNRTFVGAQLRSGLSPENTPGATLARACRIDTEGREITPVEVWLVRGSIIFGTVALCCVLQPFALHGLGAAGAGLFFGLLVVCSEVRLRRAAMPSVVGGAAGALFGIFAALLTTLIVSRTAATESTKFFVECVTLFSFAYLGLMIGSAKGAILLSVAANLDVAAGRQAESSARVAHQDSKLLDTSVLIDGRIADICEAQFLDGILIVPKFVLHELQLVADSSDGLKRPRGRRGLEVLDRIRKMPGIHLQVLEDDSSTTDAVDHKLIEIALRTGAKIVTNDFNLNKVATVQGVSVLNVNLLANALKPVVLPGETLRVLIQRDGKEPGQGISYLHDGTMVVVDGARRFISKQVDAIVTSVHQSPAGKMIFARVDERSEPGTGVSRHVSAAGTGT